jgi:DHA2 family multidrug resistance protein
VLIPAVFSAVFLLFPFRLQGLATTLAGVLAVLAPTLGPVVGGWITETYSWRWLFLINLAPGLLTAVGVAALAPRTPAAPDVWRRLDLVGLASMVIALAALEIALKDAPGRGWTSPLVLGLLALSSAAAVGFAVRTLVHRPPVVELRLFANHNFTVGSLLSFILGFGLFGSVYLMPVFLAFVRGHHALRIGEIMLVTGAAQLLTAPIAVALERRLDARWLAAFGFALLGLGLGLSARQTPQTDFAQMVWPQIVRGVAFMFCLLAPTRLALGQLPPEAIPDASGLFNLMRNLGGAIGLALIDTVIFGRAPHHAAAIIASLQAGDAATAQAVGIPLELFRAHGSGPLDPGTARMLAPMVQKLALVRAINEAWTLIAALTLLAVFSLPFVQNTRHALSGSGERNRPATTAGFRRHRA